MAHGILHDASGPHRSDSWFRSEFPNPQTTIPNLVIVMGVDPAELRSDSPSIIGLENLWNHASFFDMRTSFSDLTEMLVIAH